MTSLKSASPTEAETEQQNATFDFDRKRLALIFKENQPEWKCCCCGIKKKTVVENIGKFFLFFIMICYIIYQLSKYIDPDENRRQYSKVASITEIPLPYIYIDYYSDNDCGFGFYSGQDWGTTGNVSWYEPWYYGEYYESSSLQTVFNYVDNYGSTYIFNDDDDWTQILFIPNGDDTIQIDSKGEVGFAMICTNYPYEFWTLSGHRDELRTNYESLNDALNGMFDKSKISESGYRSRSTYRWYETQDQKVFQIKETGQYFDVSIQGTYSLYENTTWLAFSPDANGIKTILKSVPYIDLLDIFGLAGGMYSSVEQILAYITVALIWGFSCCCCKISGVANETGPDGVLRQQLEGLLKARDETIVELTHRITETETKVDRLTADGEHGDISASNQPVYSGRRISRRTDQIYKQTSPGFKSAVSPLNVDFQE